VHKICHAHCPDRGAGWVWYLLVLAALAAVCGIAVKVALHWLAAHPADDVLLACPLVMTGFGLVWKARERGRAGLPNPARATPQVPSAPAGVTGRLRVPHDDGRR
jgi:hypothetical protein